MNETTSLALQGSGQAMQMLDTMSRSTQRHVRREAEQLAKRTIIGCQHEEGRAQIAQAAMMGAATVGMTHESLLEMAPMAEDNLRALSMAYGIGASKAIMQW
jgi:predicted lipoprotein